MKKSHIFAAILALGVYSWEGWVCYQIGYAQNISVIEKASYDKGFKDGEFHGAVVGPSKFLDYSKKKEEEQNELKIADYWEQREFNGKFLFFSRYASPPLFNTFNSDTYNYFYSDDGVYAFPIESFNFEEIYELIKKAPPKEEKNRWGGQVEKI